MIVGSFIFFLALFLGIGLYAHLHSRHSHRDYLLANQETPPWLAGLSAGATANSGYMFTGLIGYAYLVGLPSIWLGLGMIIGDIVASSFIHRRLRSVTNMGQAETYAGILSHWNGTDFRMYRHLAGFVSLIFLSTYAAAQFVAGSKALHVLFGWEEFVGALIGAAIVASYSWAGGIRASIWTDALQAIVMMVAMIVLLVLALDFVGGISAAWTALDAVSPTHLDLVPPDLQFGALGPLLFGLGWIVAGFCVVGQPHIMVRFMTLDRPENTNRARVYYYAWTFLFGLVATAMGLLTRILLPPDVVFDAELALPTVALDLLPGILVGVVIAGMFAATLSTADSLILSCAANLTDDFAPEDRLPLVIVRGGT
ncbi:MAG: sodium/proline symporter, partial [Gammaproteobacteria bacterium]|nr:sodium/proline symporter [Gammaproteobacteria bacterium]